MDLSMYHWGMNLPGNSLWCVVGWNFLGSPPPLSGHWNAKQSVPQSCCTSCQWHSAQDPSVKEGRTHLPWKKSGKQKKTKNLLIFNVKTGPSTCLWTEHRTFCQVGWKTGEKLWLLGWQVVKGNFLCDVLTLTYFLLPHLSLTHSLFQTLAFC